LQLSHWPPVCQTHIGQRLAVEGGASAAMPTPGRGEPSFYQTSWVLVELVWQDLWHSAGIERQVVIPPLRRGSHWIDFDPNAHTKDL
tara:strand:- start:17013 stop:17273 length:261 start_codon:yes stop_codon:yes gene_type:complete